MGAAAVTDDTWEQEVKHHKGHVLVDFWAEWCGPCKMIAPILDQLAVEAADKVKVLKCDMDASSGKANELGIRQIPCLVLFKDGEEVDRAIGARNKAQLKAWIEEHAG